MPWREMDEFSKKLNGVVPNRKEARTDLTNENFYYRADDWFMYLSLN
jgi:hypothetical protein